MKIGWVRDYTIEERPGGAQVCEKLLREAAPNDVELVACPPGQISAEVDSYIVLRCQRYSVEEIQKITQKPFLHVAFDFWEWGSFEQRTLVMSHARQILFNSPLHQNLFVRRYGLGHKGKVLPCPMDVDHWLSIREKSNGRSGTMWYGEIHQYKGVDLLVKWAVENEVNLDIYGIGLTTTVPSNNPNIRVRGYVSDADRDLALASHSRFAHFPRKPEPFCYSLLESWLAGLQVTYSGRIGIDSFDIPWVDLVKQCSESADKMWETAGAVL